MQPHLEFARGQATGRREAFEHAAAALRRKAASWKAAELKRGRLVAALRWWVTEEWAARVEALAGELEQQAAHCRAEEQALSLELSAPAPARRWPWSRK